MSPIPVSLGSHKMAMDAVLQSWSFQCIAPPNWAHCVDVCKPAKAKTKIATGAQVSAAELRDMPPIKPDAPDVVDRANREGDGHLLLDLLAEGDGLGACRPLSAQAKVVTPAERLLACAGRPLADGAGEEVRDKLPLTRGVVGVAAVRVAARPLALPWGHSPAAQKGGGTGGSESMRVSACRAGGAGPRP